MALTLTDAFVSAFEKIDVHPIFLVSITDGVSTWKATSGSCDHMSYPEAVVSASSVPGRVDPFNRTTSVGECVVEFEDEWIRPIMVNNILEGQKITVLIGARELQESDFAYYFGGTINSPAPDGAKQTVSVNILDAFGILTTEKITGAWINRHPLEALYMGDGSGILEKGKVDSSLIDTTTFDPSQAQYSDISHFVVSRGAVGGLYHQMIKEPTDAAKVAAEVARLINGQFTANEQGKLAFARFDGTASAVDSFGPDDILPGSFSQKPLLDNVINHVAIGFRKSKTGNYAQTITLQDAASQAAFAYPGTSARVFSRAFDTDWINSVGYLDVTINDSATSLTCVGSELEGFSGNRSDAWSTVSSSRPVYLMLDSYSEPTVRNIEFIKCEGMTRHTTEESFKTYYDETIPGYVQAGPYSARLGFSSITREVLGSAKSEHIGNDEATTSSKQVCRIYDITVLVNYINDTLSRYKDGASIVKFSTGFHKYKNQISDLITLEEDSYLDYGFDGLDGSEKFEIISKEPDVYSTPPSIRWSAIYAGTGTPTLTGNGRTLNIFDLADVVDGLNKDGDLVQAHSLNGLVVTNTSGLDVSLSPGIASGYATSAHVDDDTDITLTASRDTYITLDTLSGAITARAVAVGAAAPVMARSEALIAKIETDGSGVVVGGIDQSGKVSEPIGNITAITNRALDDIQDGSTYVRVADVSVSHQIQEDSIASGAVVAGKIAAGGVSASNQIASEIIEASNVADGAIGFSTQNMQSEIGASINLNCDFSQFTRG